MPKVSEAEIIEAINPVLENSWSQKQLAKGKWFETQLAATASPVY